MPRSTGRQRGMTEGAGARVCTGVAMPSMRPVAERATSSVPVVLGLLQDRVVRARVADAIRGRGIAMFCESREHLRQHLACRPVDIVVAACRDAAGQSMVPVLAEIRRDYPLLPVVAFVVPGRTPTADILAVGELGVHELVMQGFDDVGIALAAALESATHRSAGARVLSALGPHVPQDVLPLLRYALERAGAEPSVVDAARYLGVHPKTLTYRLRQAALPPPSAIIGWCRLFLAAHLLEAPGRSVAQVALSLNFASSAALRGMLRRYTGLRPGEIRATGGLEAMINLFRQQRQRV